MATTYVPFCLSGAALLLAACQVETTGMETEAAAEQRCMELAAAAITDPDTELRRTREGGYAEVKMNRGFVMSVTPSEAFASCMAASGAAPVSSTTPAAAPASTAPLSFTADEQVIWDGLSDADRAAAYAFIQGGGTLAEFVAQGT